MEKLLERSRDLFLKYGIRNITMDKLSADLGISKKTLYRTIPNKSALIEKIVSSFLEEQKLEIQAVKPNTKNAIEEMHLMAEKAIIHIRRMLPNVTFELQKYYPESWQLVENHHTGFLQEVIKENLKRGISEGLYRSDLNLDIIPIFYASKIAVVVDSSLYQQYGYGQDTVFRVFLILSPPHYFSKQREFSMIKIMFRLVQCVSYSVLSTLLF